MLDYTEMKNKTSEDSNRQLLSITNTTLENYVPLFL